MSTGTLIQKSPDSGASVASDTSARSKEAIAFCCNNFFRSISQRKFSLFVLEREFDLSAQVLKVECLDRNVFCFKAFYLSFSWERKRLSPCVTQ